MDIEVLEVLPGNRAIVSTKRFVRLTRHGRIINEMLERDIAEEVAASANSHGAIMQVVEYHPEPTTVGGAS